MKRFIALALGLASVPSLHAAIVISEIDLIGNKVEIVNTGPTSVDLTGYYMCNRLIGSPFYVALIASQIDVTNSTDNNLLLASGDVMTLGLSASFITDATGEFGLYLNSSNYGSAANMVDYVGWGADGVRDSVAAAKGIWALGTFVNVSAVPAGQTVQLKLGQPGNAVADYHIQPSTIGVAQSVPEPSSVALGLLGGAALLARRSRRKG